MSFTISLSDIPSKSDSYLRDNYIIRGNIGSNPREYLNKVTQKETNEERLVRIIPKNSITSTAGQNRLLCEISVLSRLEHPNLGSLYEYYQDLFNYYIIMERFTGESLYDRLLRSNNQSEQNCMIYMQQLFAAIRCLSENKIAHRDIKIENLIFGSGEYSNNLKLVSFSSCYIFKNDEFMAEKVGSPYYLAPEMIRRHYDFRCDWWSAGVIMYIILSGSPPFVGKSENEVISNITIGNVTFTGSIWKNISSQAKDLITGLLRLNPDERLTPQQALDHPWLSTTVPQAPSRESSAQFISDLSHLRSSQKLKKSLLKYLSVFFISLEEYQELYGLFSYFDSNLNGRISKNELKVGFIRLFGNRIRNAEREIEKLLENADFDESGELSYNEFVTAAMGRQNIIEQRRLRRIFKSIDSNDNGFIDAQELQAALSRCLTKKNDTWEELIKECDTNGDGLIDITEFTNLMLSNK
ncbi:hypothetical protein SteCoe_7174 [Stentor coeruleus]|uniref:Calmodulin n=1 Tax=Stentor coeruleus TaxID=5963 RepID=A0A1R2CN82_9CILI|nr:hypothetical protein SteCoe_7174 [Stentor coeruleus]